jgi:hypothetical protein
VARVKNFSQGNGILILEESDNNALSGSGGGTLIVNEGGVVVNSTGEEAATTDGSTTILAATSFDVTGNYSGDRFFQTPYPASGPAVPYTGSVPVPDPLRNLPEPNPADFTVQNAPNNGGPDNAVITLQPGRYTTRLHYTASRTIVLQPGLYYLERGLSLEGNAQLIAEGVMLYNRGSGNQGISLAGGGSWTLTPPLSGTYEGVSLFQSRTTANENTTTVLSGNGGGVSHGTIYCPTTKVQLTGNGTQTLGSQFIARTLEMSGNGTFTVDFAAPKAPQPPVLELVE